MFDKGKGMRFVMTDDIPRGKACFSLEIDRADIIQVDRRVDEEGWRDSAHPVSTKLYALLRLAQEIEQSREREKLAGAFS